MEPTPTRPPRHQLHRALQHPPAPPHSQPATTAREQSIRSPGSSSSPSREINPVRRPHPRVPKRSLTSHDAIFAPTRYLSDSAYWLYLAHLPLIIAGQALIRDWDTPASVRFLGLCAISTLILLASYQLFIRYTPIGWLLNGRRTPPDSGSLWGPPSNRHLTLPLTADIASDRSARHRGREAPPNRTLVRYRRG
ncbi:MAG: acyltransferase family protein [bacterium]|nr:acyltransferase family protein [bacterium]